jgi:hypothetical protein
MVAALVASNETAYTLGTLEKVSSFTHDLA